MIFLQLHRDNMKSSFLLIILLSLLSCCKDDNKKENTILNNRGEITFLPYLWKYQINVDGKINHNPELRNNMVFGGNVIIPTTENSKSRFLTCLNSVNGQKQWQWNDWYQPLTEGGDFTWDVRHNNHLHWTTGSRRYTIDLATGENVFRHRNEDLFSFSSRFSSDQDEIYFNSQINTDDGFIVYPIFKSNIYNSEIKEVLRIPFSKDTLGVENRTKSPDWITPISFDGKKYLFIISAQAYPEWYYDQRVNLYNLTDNKWIYRDKIAAIPKQNNGGWSKLIGNKFYFTAGREMFSYDVFTGTQIWKREFPHDFTFSGFEIFENIIVANCENGRTYGLNLLNGTIIWETEGSGTSSKLQNRIMNGIAYFVGGGPIYVYAKDIKTGKTIWKLDPLLFEKDEGGAIWRKEINVIPAQNGEKPKIVICSQRYAYCFEALH